MLSGVACRVAMQCALVDFTVDGWAGLGDRSVEDQSVPSLMDTKDDYGPAAEASSMKDMYVCVRRHHLHTLTPHLSAEQR